MRIPSPAPDHKIVSFEPALEELAISPEPRSLQREPGNFECVLAAMTNPLHRAGAHKLFIAKAPHTSVTGYSNTLGGVSQTRITEWAARLATIAAWRNASRSLRQCLLLAVALVVSMLIAIGLFSLGWLLGALAIWLSRPGEAAQRASFQINSGTRGLVAQDHAPNEKPGGLIYIPLEAGEDQPPEKDIRDNRAPRGSGLALPRKVALERDRKQFIEPNRTLPLADPVMLPSPPEIPPKLAFAAAMWGIDSDLAARAIIAAPQVSKRPGRFKSAVRAVFAPPRPGAKHELNSTKQ